VNIEKLKDKMKGTCFGSISFCCGLDKECKYRDQAIKKLGITKMEFIKLKYKFDENLLSLIKRNNA
jgi:predicted metal-binding transcription factor (methanogenesis marker protein 9)